MSSRGTRIRRGGVIAGLVAGLAVVVAPLVVQTASAAEPAATPPTTVSAPDTSPAIAGPHIAAASSHFVWTVTNGSKLNNSTAIDNPDTNFQPNALLYVTPVYNAGGNCGCTYDNSPFGVWYDSSVNKWRIFREDFTSMTVGESFNVLVVYQHSSKAFQVSASASNVIGNAFYFSKKATNANPTARLIVTQVITNTDDIYNNSSIGLVYRPKTSRWGIYDYTYGTGMPVGASFNVLVDGGPTGGTSKTQIAKISNIAGNWTAIKNDVTNGRADSFVFATANYNANGVGGPHGGVGDNHAIGVFYLHGGAHMDQMAVYNQDQVAMPVGAAFNVLLFQN